MVACVRTTMAFCVILYELLSLQIAIAGMCSRQCEENGDMSCCTCQRHLFDRGCYRHCLRANSETCVRNCYTSRVMYDYEYFSCFGCNRYFNSTTDKCMQCPGSCISCLHDAFCLDCKKGFYGNACDKRCGHCQPFHNVQSECDIENGICIKGCSNGYYGLRCESKCGQCLPDASNVVKCEKDTGNCVNGCADNYYGQRCNNKCRQCIPDDKGKILCHRDTGFCFNNCATGYFGNACNETCSDKCLPSKSNEIRCDKLSGNCIYGCVPGWYGKNCDKPCRRNCLDKVCFQDSGRCMDGCVTGWYGNKCNKPCWISCFNKSCVQNTGRCSTGCVNGWYSNTCSKPCKITCLNRYCLQDTGRCSEGCVTGWYGDKCNIPCSSFCFNRTCIQKSGYCEHGCVMGFYGDMCEFNCTVSCFEKYCDRETSACLKGCDKGYTGLFCNFTIENESNSTSNEMFAILAWLIALSVFAVVASITRRVIKRQKKNDSREIRNTVNDEISYVNGREHRVNTLYWEIGSIYDTIQDLCDYDSHAVKTSGDKFREISARSSLEADSLRETIKDPPCSLNAFKTNPIVIKHNINDPESVGINEFCRESINKETKSSSIYTIFETCPVVDNCAFNNNGGYITPVCDKPDVDEILEINKTETIKETESDKNNDDLNYIHAVN